MSAGVEGSKRLHARPPARPTSRMLAAEAAAAVNLAVSPEAKEAEAARHHPAPAPADSRPAARGDRRRDRTSTAESSDRPATDGPAGVADHHAEAEPHDHHLLIDAHEDRWAWRRKIRQNPRKLFFYRICVALLGLLLVVPRRP